LPSETTSTSNPVRSSTSAANPASSINEVLSCAATKMSMSLWIVSSRRATEPKTRTSLKPFLSALRRISSRFSLKASEGNRWVARSRRVLVDRFGVILLFSYDESLGWLVPALFANFACDRPAAIRASRRTVDEFTLILYQVI
jgi:hypothetical protein